VVGKHSSGNKVMERTGAPVLVMPGGTAFNSGWGNSGLWASDTVVGSNAGDVGVCMHSRM
jgi:hypothetical protein